MEGHDFVGRYTLTFLSKTLMAGRKSQFSHTYLFVVGSITFNPLSLKTNMCVFLTVLHIFLMVLALEI